MNAPHQLHPRPRTSLMTISSAQICRDLGWWPGTHLESLDVGEGNAPRIMIRITAIGETEILGRVIEAAGIEHLGDESIFNLICRDWQRV